MHTSFLRYAVWDCVRMCWEKIVVDAVEEWIVGCFVCAGRKCLLKNIDVQCF